MRRSVEPLTVDEFFEAADALVVETMKSHASTTQILIQQAIEVAV
jgi:hypothetical protein